MSSEEQDGYEGTGHLPAPAQFAGSDKASGTASSGKQNRLKRQNPLKKMTLKFQGAIPKKFRRPRAQPADGKRFPALAPLGTDRQECRAATRPTSVMDSRETE